jgi:two-component system OmpR family sensor kinase
LIASYALLLLLALAVLGVALNVVIARTLYNTEFTFFQSEAVAAVAATQQRFDTLTLGQMANGCAGAMSYEEAFREAIAQPIIASHPGGIHGVYLLDGSGAVLAPLSAQNSTSATPYLQMAHLRALELKASARFNGAPVASGSRQLADEGYVVLNRSAAAPYGVELIALRYYTGSSCVAAPTALGFVEIVTKFSRSQVALASLRWVMALTLMATFVVGLLLGGPLISAALAPLTRVTQTARQVAQGDLRRRARLSHSDDEAGQLGAVFDLMLARIESAFAATQRSEDRMRQFIADASHELRTPLTSIRGYTDVLLRGAKDDPETAEHILLATRREAERMSRLVNDLLTLARLDAARPAERRPLTPVDLVALAGESVDQARILAGDRQVLFSAAGAGPLLAPADPDQIKQVLLVLLDNALKYGRQDASGWARLTVQRQPGWAVITVEDNGPGVAPDDLPHVFERFYRADRAARARRHATPQALANGNGGASANESAAKPEGSGLGLAIAQAIAQSHSGSLTVQSQFGVGATFTLSLPTVPVSSPAANVRRADSASASRTQRSAP